MRELFTNADKLVTADSYTEYINKVKESRSKLLKLRNEMSSEEYDLLSTLHSSMQTKIQLLSGSRGKYETLEEESQTYYTEVYEKEYAPKDVITPLTIKQAEEEFEGDYGIRRNKNGLWESNSQFLRDIISLDNEIKRVTEILGNNASEAVQEYLGSVKVKIPRLVGKVNTPIGYDKEGKTYVLKADYLDTLNTNINGLESIYASLDGTDLVELQKQVKSNIQKWKSVKERHLKNIILESMLKIISNRDMYYRTMFAIDMSILDPTKYGIPSSKKKLDLSNAADKYEAYKSVTDGGILTGAFANAVKVFSYVSRTSNYEEINEMYKRLGNLKKLRAYPMLLNKMTVSDVLSKEDIQELGFNNGTPLRDVEQLSVDSLIRIESGKIKQVLSAQAVNDELPQVSAEYHFSIGNNVYSKLSRIDSDGNYRSTFVFDALLNAAIDNLKEQKLPDINVNTNTGSAIVGLVSMGVPLRLAIRILKHPFLKDLSSGKVWKVDSWIYEQKVKYKDVLEKIVTEELELGEDFFNKTDDVTNMLVFEVFRKAYKVGEDIRALASYLDIIRTMDVFIEDIEQTKIDLGKKIGTINVEGDKWTLIPRSDFSLVIPNLYEQNPHIKQAQVMYDTLVETIRDTFLIHSAPIVKLVDAIPHSFLVAGQDTTTAAEKSALKRKVLMHLLYSNVAWEDRLKTIKPVVERGFVKSPQRVFSEEVAKKLKKIQEYRSSNKLPKNRFLMFTSSFTDWKRDTNTIKFTGGVNLNAGDVQAIMRDFRLLNTYDFNEAGEVIASNVHPQFISDFQKDLMYYALINYGLEFSTSNFSNYLPAALLKQIDAKVDAQLRSLTSNPNIGSNILNELLVNFAVSQYESIRFVSNLAMYKEDGNYHGVDTLKDATGVETKVYFDRKVLKSQLDREDTPLFFKQEFRNRSKMYVKVFETDAIAYYQLVGKISEVYLRGRTIDEDITKYELSNYFSPHAPTLHYWVDNDTNFISGVNPGPIVKQGDVMWITPSYSTTRLERKAVKITKVEPTSFKPTGSKTVVKGFKYFYENPSAAEIENLNPKQAVDLVQEERAREEQSLLPVSYGYNTNLGNADKTFERVERDGEEITLDNNGTQYETVTSSVIPAMKNRQWGKRTPGEIQAAKHWEGRDPSEKIKFPHILYPVNMEEFINHTNFGFKKAVAKGDITHYMLQHRINPSNELVEKINELMEAYEFKKADFAWIDEKFGGIMLAAGADLYTRKWDKNSKKFQYVLKSEYNDRLHSEIDVWLDLATWKVKGTIDLVIDHGDDLYTLIDFKSGSSFSKVFETDMFKYGSTSTEDIFDTPRNRAKLQLMWYAVMFKHQYPNASFRKIKPMELHSLGHFSEKELKYDVANNINVPAYLEMIEGYLKKHKPEVHKVLSETKGMFDVDTYTKGDYTQLDDPKTSVDANIKMLQLKLQGLILKHRNFNEVLTTSYDAQKTLDEIKEVMDKIINLKKDKTYSSWADDLSITSTYFASASSSTNFYVQLYFSVLKEQKMKAKEEFDSIMAVHNRLLTKLMESMGMKPALKGFISGVNSNELFDWMYIKDESGNIVRYKNDRVASEVQGLTDTQIKYLKFTLDNIERFFVNEASEYIDPRTGKRVALANRIVTERDKNGTLRALTNLDVYNEGKRLGQGAEFTYQRGVIPTIPPSSQDIRERYGWTSKEHLDHLYHSTFTNFFEAEYDNAFSKDEVMPMKYLGSNSIRVSQNFSTNNEIILHTFLRDYLNKEHLEEAAVLGSGLRYYLIALQNKDTNVEFGNLINYFEKSVKLHVLGQKQDSLNLSSRPGRINTSTGWKRFNWVKFLRSIKNYFGAATMWLKPVSGTANFLFASLYNIKEGIKGSTVGGTFGLGDLIWAWGQATAYTKDAMMGNLKNNKLHLLMDKYKFYNDSYDWYTSPNKLLTTNNKLFSSNTMYMFHSLPEEIISITIYAAQLKSMKAPNGKSMWDNYDVTTTTDSGEEVSTLQYVGGVRGKRKISNVAGYDEYEDVTELTPEEVISMNYLYEKIHGGYKSEERSIMEYYIMGELIMQFKKYLPSMVRNNFASKGVRRAEGFFKIVGKDESGKDILQWTPQVVEGRWRLLLNVLLHTVGVKFGPKTDTSGSGMSKFLGLQTNDSYDWSNLSDYQKQEIWDGIITLAMFSLLLVGYNQIWDADEEDSTKKVYKRVMNDFAAQWYFPELVNNLLNIQPVSLEKSRKWIGSASEVTSSLFLYGIGNEEDALTQAGNLRGWKNFQRNNPLFASWHDAFKWMEEDNTLLDYRSH